MSQPVAKTGSIPGQQQGAGWTSWHLHVSSGAPEVLDKVIMDVVVPVVTRLDVRGQSRPWFFVRYWQYGPHLRLRIRDLSSPTTNDVTAELTDRLAPINHTIPVQERIDPAGYRAMAAVAAAGEGDGPLPLGELRPPGVYREVYEPEYERYGGHTLMELSESLFHLSSRLAVGLLRTSLTTPGVSRGMVGLNALAAGLTAVGDAAPGMERFAARSGDVWAAYARSTRDPDSTGELVTAARADAARLAEQPTALLQLLRVPPEALGRWAAALREACEVWRTVGLAERILRSHLHMIANRLGLGTGGELYTWTVLAEFLQHTRSDVLAPIPTDLP